MSLLILCERVHKCMTNIKVLCVKYFAKNKHKHKRTHTTNGLQNRLYIPHSGGIDVRASN